MKKVGIVGGVGWPSTIDYYAELCRLSEQWHLAKDPQKIPSTPEMSIESLDLSKAVGFIAEEDNEDDWATFDEYHRKALQRLETSGADFALIASNTPHHRLASIVRGVRIPVLSLWDVVAAEVSRRKAKAVLILGTDLTMRSAAFREILAKHGICSYFPTNPAIRMSLEAVISKLQRGAVTGAKEEIHEIACRALAPGDSDKLVCLSCTELPLAFGENSTPS